MVDANPSGAEVRINGQQVGVTPHCSAAVGCLSCCVGIADVDGTPQAERH